MSMINAIINVPYSSHFRPFSQGGSGISIGSGGEYKLDVGLLGFFLPLFD